MWVRGWRRAGRQLGAPLTVMAAAGRAARSPGTRGGGGVALRPGSVLRACAPATSPPPATPSCRHVGSGRHPLALLQAGVVPPEVLLPGFTLQSEVSLPLSGCYPGNSSHARDSPPPPGKGPGNRELADVKQHTTRSVCARARVHVHVHTCAAWGGNTLTSLRRQGTGAEHGV